MEMKPRLSLKPIHEWTEDECVALRALSQAVYPPEEADQQPGRRLDWAAAQWGVQVIDADGELLSYTGIVRREALHDGQRVQIAGVGGVKTHPAARRRGFAELALRRASEFFHEQDDIEFGLLVCFPKLFKYYSRLGWQVFGGRLLTTQTGEKEEFTW